MSASQKNKEPVPSKDQPNKTEEENEASEVIEDVKYPALDSILDPLHFYILLSSFHNQECSKPEWSEAR